MKRKTTHARKSAGSEPIQFQVEAATEGDWPFIVEGQAAIAWARLGPKRRREVDRQALERHVAQHVAELRREEGFPTQAFVAKTDKGKPAGFVWMAKTHNDFTGQVEASLLNQYVAEPYRGRGLGRRLIQTAEQWARRQGLPRICLSVGANNALSQGLYKTMGYHVDTLRMSKALAATEPEVILSDY